MSTTVGDRITIPPDVLADLFRRYHIRELRLFGSILRDDFRDDSDVDILVEFQPGAPIGLYEHFDLSQELTALIGRKVDLVSRRGLNPLIRDAVLASSRVLHAA
jgi:predicted nucleotidyltransferase